MKMTMLRVAEIPKGGFLFLSLKENLHIGSGILSSSSFCSVTQHTAFIQVASGPMGLLELLLTEPHSSQQAEGRRGRQKTH